MAQRRIAAAKARQGALAGASGSSPSTSPAPAAKGKGKRFLWTDELHARFVAAVFDHGLKTCTPKLLFGLMQPAPERMTTDHIKSHLQKYRNNSKQSRSLFLEDYERALEQATERAREEERRTGVPSFPPHFSTYPVVLPGAGGGRGQAAITEAIADAASEAAAAAEEEEEEGDEGEGEGTAFPHARGLSTNSTAQPSQLPPGVAVAPMTLPQHLSALAPSLASGADSAIVLAALQAFQHSIAAMLTPQQQQQQRQFPQDPRRNTAFTSLSPGTKRHEMPEGFADAAPKRQKTQRSGDGSGHGGWSGSKGRGKGPMSGKAPKSGGGAGYDANGGGGEGRGGGGGVAGSPIAQSHQEQAMALLQSLQHMLSQQQQQQQHQQPQQHQHQQQHQQLRLPPPPSSYRAPPHVAFNHGPAVAIQDAQFLAQQLPSSMASRPITSSSAGFASSSVPHHHLYGAPPHPYSHAATESPQRMGNDSPLHSLSPLHLSSASPINFPSLHSDPFRLDDLPPSLGDFGNSQDGFQAPLLDDKDIFGFLRGASEHR